MGRLEQRTWTFAVLLALASCAPANLTPFEEEQPEPLDGLLLMGIGFDEYEGMVFDVEVLDLPFPPMPAVVEGGIFEVHFEGEAFVDDGLFLTVRLLAVSHEECMEAEAVFPAELIMDDPPLVLIHPPDPAEFCWPDGESF
ncbi:MAG: hypothetical protein AAGE52_10995 [Myxococcota bacterium]